VFDEGLLVEQGGFQELAADPESRFGMMCAIQSVSADDTRQLFN
jgi:ABC-type multidrug transport system fused ATPase/permease subunit